MALRINSSTGLVLHAGSQQGGSAELSLSVSEGHLQLLLLLDGVKKKVNLRSRKKYNDNRWHTVSSHEGRWRHGDRKWRHGDRKWARVDRNW